MSIVMHKSDAKKILRRFKSNKIASSNIIIDLLKDFEGDSKNIKKSITILNQIFCQLLKDQDLKPLSNLPENVHSAKVKYEMWLLDRYEDVHNQLLLFLGHSDCQVQQLALSTLVKFMQTEMNHPLAKESSTKLPFPILKLERLFSVLFSLSSDNHLLIKRLKEYLECPDFICSCLPTLQNLMEVNKEIRDNEIYIKNIFTILEMICLPIEGIKPLNSPRLFGYSGKDTEEMEKKASEFVFPYEEMKIHFNNIWEIFLNFYLPTDIYKRCLIIIPEKVIMHLDRPVKLTDFFMNAYNLGDALSVIALQGVFVLVNQYNLEYPDFYNKVYALFQPTIFQASFRPRFFMLCDKFFSSTLLPEYIVAAFIKRMSRLVLIANSNCQILLLKFIVNLLLMYPSLHRLMHNPDVTSIENDPYLPDESNPKLCKAGDSSLWEVATLRHHLLCGISKAANFITRNLPDVEHDLSKHVSNTYEELIEKAEKIKEPRVFTTTYEPESSFKYSDEDMGTSWSVL